jgi:hypothetical protein
MAVFYNRERGKLGSLTGTIISFPTQLLSNDPKDTKNRDLLPAGYLRCDGSVLFAEEYPLLAQVLGVGGTCRYKKPDTELADNEFQLPDLRSKHIRATTSANIGLYNDLYVTDVNDQQVTKAGAGLDVIQNIESPFKLTYNGEFYIPPQTSELRGEPGFTLETGAYTYETGVQENMFQPHLHRTTTSRARQKDRNGNDFGNTQNNSQTSPTSLNVCLWWENTRQMLCYWQITTASAVSKPGENPVPTFADGFFGGMNRQDQYGLCWYDCSNFTTSGYCLWPSTDSCPDVDNQIWNVRLDNDGCNNGGGDNGDTTTFGNITYEPTWTIDCVCPSGAGCPNGVTPKQKNSDILTNFGEGDAASTNLPFTQLDPDYYPIGYGGVSNVTIQSGEFGDEGIHRHRIPVESDEPHTYKMITRAAEARADQGLDSSIVIDINTSKKADKYIQPYIITEYLIKI